MSFLQFTKDDVMRGIELGVMALLGLLVLLLGRAPDDPPHHVGPEAPRRGGRGRAHRRTGRTPLTVGAAAPAMPAARRHHRRRRRQHHHAGGPNVSIVGSDERSRSPTAPRR